MIKVIFARLFYYKDKKLFCEGLEIEAIAMDVETPF